MGKCLNWITATQQQMDKFSRRCRDAIASDDMRHERNNKGDGCQSCGNCGVSDETLLNLIIGRVKLQGRLPFVLPSSMHSVAAQKPDVPSDSKDRLYLYGYGLGF